LFPRARRQIRQWDLQLFPLWRGHSGIVKPRGSLPLGSVDHIASSSIQKFSEGLRRLRGGQERYAGGESEPVGTREEPLPSSLGKGLLLQVAFTAMLRP